jgi:uncharacterized protein YhaN
VGSTLALTNQLDSAKKEKKQQQKAMKKLEEKINKLEKKSMKLQGSSTELSSESKQVSTEQLYEEERDHNQVSEGLHACTVAISIINFC